MILPKPNELDRIVWSVQAKVAKAILLHGSMPLGCDLLKLVQRHSRCYIWALARDLEEGPRLVEALRRLIPLESARPAIDSEWWWSGCIVGHKGSKQYLIDGDVPSLMEMLHSIICESVLADLRGG